MERFLGRVAPAVARRRRLVICAWLALVAGSAWFSLHQTDRLSGGGWDVPGSQSVRASKLISEFPAFDGVRFAVLVESATPERTAAAAARARVELATFEDLRPYGPPRAFEGGRAVLIPLLYTERAEDAIDFATRLGMRSSRT